MPNVHPINNEKGMNTPALAQGYSVEFFLEFVFHVLLKTNNYLYDKILLNTAFKGLILLI